MSAPDTALHKTVRLGGGRLWWRAPNYIGTAAADGALSGESASVVYRPTSGDVTSTLTPAWATLTVQAQPARDELTVTPTADAAIGVLPYGDAWLWTPHGGALPVRVQRAADGGATLSVYLADRLPVDLDVSANARLQSALWYVDESTATVVDTVTRSSAGDYPIPYTIDWQQLQPANPAGAGAITAAGYRVEGTLSVVRQPFATGVATADVYARFPELARMAAAGSAGLEAAVYAEHEALRLAVDAAVRQAGASPYTWADDVSAAPFAPCHATMVAARVVDTVDPERAQRLRAQAEVLFSQALTVAWVDRDRDGVVDEGETPALIGFSTSSSVLPSSVADTTDWWSFGERR